MALALGGGEPPGKFCLLLAGREVGERDVELGAFHIQIHPDEALGFGQGGAGIHGVVEQVAEDAAEVQLAHLQPDRDVGIDLHRNVPALREGDLAVEDGIRHGVARLDRKVHGVQVGVQLVKVGPDAFQIPLCRQDLHGLDVAAVIVPPAPHLAVHVIHLFVMRLDKLPLVGFDAVIQKP